MPPLFRIFKKEILYLQIRNLCGMIREITDTNEDVTV